MSKNNKNRLFFTVAAMASFHHKASRAETLSYLEDRNNVVVYASHGYPLYTYDVVVGDKGFKTSSPGTNLIDGIFGEDIGNGDHLAQSN